MLRIASILRYQNGRKMSKYFFLHSVAVYYNKSFIIVLDNKDVYQKSLCLLQMRGQAKRQTKPSAPMMVLPNWIMKRGASSLDVDDDVHVHVKKV